MKVTFMSSNTGNIFSNRSQRDQIFYLTVDTFFQSSYGASLVCVNSIVEKRFDYKVIDALAVDKFRLKS